ncbi:MAG: leucine-rich repeat domain-containing protein [Lachnospiraceae bacterium]|nr:leucine-rich repeat domain-containing protein [Lachnospiraceae bacterium]
MENIFTYKTEEGLKIELFENPDGSLTLLSCSRKPREAMSDTLRLRGFVGDKPIRRIAPLAFAPFHMEEDRFRRLFHAPYSFNMFVLMNGGWLVREKEESGGPARRILLPDTVEEIGPYAFWHCHGTEEIRIPDGVKVLGPGTFGECADLKSVHLPESLEVLGLALGDPGKGNWSFSGEMVRGMPDVGAFFGCHSLKKLVLPSGIRALGPHTFNSCGITHLILKEGEAPGQKTDPPLICENAFDHAVSLVWMEKQDPHGRVLTRIGLPAARDKILLADRKFGRLKHVPEDFFSREVSYFDHLAREIFRMDFAARMALARLSFPKELSDGNAAWYRDLLTRYFEKAPLFMPEYLPGLEDEDLDPWERLFAFLKEKGRLRAEDVTALIRTCGEVPVSAGLMDAMITFRTREFAAATGFEDLDI